MIRVLSVIAALLPLWIVATAQASQHVVYGASGEKIVHTRLAPVLIHRAVPPYAGKHVYQGRRR
jgi:hypothetical protein